MKKFKKNFFLVIWSGVIQWSRVGINAVVFILLSRWLSLEDIGLVAAIQAPVVIFQSIATSTIPEFVVQERFFNQRRFSTLFWFSLLIGSFVTLSLILFSKLIVLGISNNDDAIIYLFVVSISPTLWALASVFEGVHRKLLNTKLLAIRTFVSNSVAAVLAIYAGYAGWGPWSLVLFSVVSAFLSCLVTVFSSNRTPRCEISWGYLKRGKYKLSALAGRNLIAASTFPLIQYFTALQLDLSSAGILQIAFRIYTLVDSIVMTPYRFVVLPLFSGLKVITKNIGQEVRKAISIGSFVSSPVYVFVIMIAPVLLPALIGQNGASSVLLVQLVAINGLFSSATLVVNQILVARGYAAVVFFRSLIMFFMVIVPCVVVARFGLPAIGLTFSLFGGCIGVFVSLCFARNILDVSMADVFYAWLKVTVSASFMLLLSILYFIDFPVDDISKLIFMSIFAPFVYLVAASFIAKDVFVGFLNAVRHR